MAQHVSRAWHVAPERIDDSKLAEAKRLGAEEIINTFGGDPADQIKDMTEEIGADAPQIEALAVPMLQKLHAQGLVPGTAPSPNPVFRTG